MKDQNEVREFKVTKKTVEKMGVTLDYKKAISEYIWNGFDAKASKINITYEVVPNTSHIVSFSIFDNGEGIDYSNLEYSFTPILDSQKDSNKDLSSYVKGKKGKGRLSYMSFCGNVVWDTIYKDNDKKNYGYTISMTSGNKNKYTNSKPSLVESSTGTSVSFSNFNFINADILESDDFLNYLRQEFAWFLCLHKEYGYTIQINNKILDYDSIISISNTETISILDKETKIIHSFELNYIEWKKKIGNYSKNYFSNSKRQPIWDKDSGFNKKGDHFFHSLYVVSDFFDKFEVIKQGNGLDIDLFGSFTNKHKVFKDLEKELRKYLLNKKRDFLKKNASYLIEKLKEEGVMPIFGTTRLDDYKKEDFESVVKEIYIFEPQIFEQKSNKQQKRTILEFLKLLLDENKREKILDIMGDIIELTEEELKDFREILTHTSIANITNLINFILKRKKVILGLDMLVFDLKKFTNERDHIQKVIENNYWLFGEQYNLVSADKNFTKLEEEYLKIIGKNPDKVILSDNQRRPDIFMVKNRKISAHNKRYEKTEHIMVELKRPSQNIGTEQYRQIEDYMQIVKDSDNLDGQFDTWKFYIVGVSLDQVIIDKYDEYKDLDDPFLIGKLKNKYRIYALTWQELFTMFENTHQDLIDKLDIDDDVLKKELDFNNIGVIEKELSTSITKEII